MSLQDLEKDLVDLTRLSQKHLDEAEARATAERQRIAMELASKAVRLANEAVSKAKEAASRSIEIENRFTTLESNLVERIKKLEALTSNLEKSNA